MPAAQPAITHDIPTNDGFRYQILNQTDERLAYAYLLGSGDCFVLFKRGKQGLVGINKCDYEQEYWLDTAKFELDWYRTYRDVLEQAAILNVQSQWVRVAIPARSARLWLQE